MDNFLRWLAVWAMVFTVEPVGAEELPPGVISVYYIFKLGDNQPVGGQSFCHVGMRCRLTLDSDAVWFTLDLSADGESLSVDCRDISRDCQLLEDWRQPYIRAGLRGFRIFAVRYDEGRFLAEQHQIGKVSIKVERASRSEPDRHL